MNTFNFTFVDAKVLSMPADPPKLPIKYGLQLKDVFVDIK
jgi:hypothetical protein